MISNAIIFSHLKVSLFILTLLQNNLDNRIWEIFPLYILLCETDQESHKHQLSYQKSLLPDTSASKIDLRDNPKIFGRSLWLAKQKIHLLLGNF